MLVIMLYLTAERPKAWFARGTVGKEKAEPRQRFGLLRKGRRSQDRRAMPGDSILQSCGGRQASVAVLPSPARVCWEGYAKT
jgi:hypothetical protein